MGYNKAMFHRMAEELDRIAYDVEDNNGEHVNEGDMFTAVNALGVLSMSFGDELASLALELAACCFGGMYEAFREQPEVEKQLLEALTKRTETDKTYVVEVTREHMRWIASRYGYRLTDEQCDGMAAYLDEDAFDDMSFEHYLENDMIPGIDHRKEV